MSEAYAYLYHNFIRSIPLFDFESLTSNQATGIRR